MGLSSFLLDNGDHAASSKKNNLGWEEMGRK